MQQSHSLYLGEQNGYYWLVSLESIPSLIEAMLQLHHGLRLCITSFDSGIIRPSDTELDIGWTMRGNVMVSPPLSATLEIPHDQYDEWYILDSPSFADDEFEVFVNYGGFTLVPPDEAYTTFDPTWEKTGLDYLAPIQARFWSQLTNIQPDTYIAMGDLDVVASRNDNFLKQVRKCCIATR